MEVEDGRVRREAVCLCQGAHGERVCSRLTDAPADRSIAQRDGTALPCFCTTLLEELQERSREEKKEADQIDPQRDFDIRWTANSMYSASIDTVSTPHFTV